MKIVDENLKTRINERNRHNYLVRLFTESTNCLTFKRG